MVFDIFVGTPTLLTSRADVNGTRSEETLVGRMLGLHDVTSQASYCVHKKSLEDKIWLGGKDDWLVVTDYRCSLSVFNPISGTSVPLLSFATIQGIQNRENHNKELYGEPYSRTIRRVVLCQTPASTNGHLALALFDDGVLAFTTRRDGVWKTLKHQTDDDGFGSFAYLPEVYMDVIVHKERVVAVNEEGAIFSWNMDDHDRVPFRIESPEFPYIEGPAARIFNLAKSPADELITICVYGKPKTYYHSSKRVLINEHDMLESRYAREHRWDDHTYI